MPKTGDDAPWPDGTLAEMRKLRVIPVLKSIAHRAHLDSAARFANRKRLLIVTYHGLREDASPHRHWLLLPLSEFARQMQYLQSHYNVVRLDDAIRDLDTESVSEPRACITFDDGYRNNLDLALPVLQRLGLPYRVVLLAAGDTGCRRLSSCRRASSEPRGSCGPRGSTWVCRRRTPRRASKLRTVWDWPLRWIHHISRFWSRTHSRRCDPIVATRC